MADLRYPIGREDVRIELTEAERHEAIAVLASTPARFRAAAGGLTEEQLDTPYRPGGWTVRQVIHHLPDSHLNAYIRFKLALTEDVPTIKPYDQALWAELPDSRTTPVEVSLTLLDSLHHRWVEVLRAMKPEDFWRKLNHPERGILTLDAMLNSYAWHSLHHIAHVRNLRERMGWS